MRHFPPIRVPNRNRGFTLIELLVVSVVMALLLMLVIPIVSYSIQHARSSNCRGNLRQIGSASLMWSADNEGRVVPVFFPRDGDPLQTTHWTGILAPYLGWNKDLATTAKFKSFDEMPVYICPERPGIFGYGHNYRRLSYHATGVTVWVNHADVPNPGRTILIVDSHNAKNPDDWRAYVRSYVNFNVGDAVIDWRHPGNSTNVLWLDGHVTSEASDGPLTQSERPWGLDIRP